MSDLSHVWTTEEAANPHAIAAGFNRLQALLLVSHTPVGAIRAETIPSGKATQGPRGERGEKGDTGPQGPPGASGTDGVRGLKGEKGDPGPQGLKGDKGDKGDPGEPSTVRGPKGDPGEKGDTGPPGPRGPWGHLDGRSLPTVPGPSGSLWNDNGFVKVAE